MSDDDNLTELSEAARRAGYIVTEQIDAIIEKAEQQADAIRREAERDAEDTRRAAHDAAQRLLARLEALEFPLGSLVASLRDEAEHVSRQLEAGSGAVDTQGTALPSGPEESQAVVEDADEVRRDEVEHPERVESDHEPEPEGDFEEVAARSVHEPEPAAAEARPEEASGDWKRWIVEDEEEDPLDQAASAVAAPKAPSHEDVGAAGEAAPRAFGRRRAKPRS